MTPTYANWLEHVEAAEEQLADAEGFPPPSAEQAQALYLGAIAHTLIAIARKLQT